MESQLPNSPREAQDLVRKIRDTGLLTREQLRGMADETHDDALATADTAPESPENPLIARFKAQYDQFRYKGKKPEWGRVLRSLTPDVLSKASNLEEAKLAGFNKKGEVLFADGTPEIPEVTSEMDYPTARTHCQTLGLSMFTLDEYKQYQLSGDEKYERKTVTWIESGKTPKLARSAFWSSSDVFSGGNVPLDSDPWLGVRRLLRVKLES